MKTMKNRFFHCSNRWKNAQIESLWIPDFVKKTTDRFSKITVVFQLAQQQKCNKRFSTRQIKLEKKITLIKPY